MVSGPAANSSPSFSALTAAVYIFNLIVGTGALALPSAFALAGWGLGTGLLVLLAIFSYITATFVVESMAACNGIKTIEQSVNSHKIDQDLTEQEEEHKRPQNFFEEPDDSDSAYLVKNDLTGQVNVTSYGTTEALNTSTTACNLDMQLELAEMADMLFNNVGRKADYKNNNHGIGFSFYSFPCSVPSKLTKVGLLIKKIYWLERCPLHP